MDIYTFIRICMYIMFISFALAGVCLFLYSVGRKLDHFDRVYSSLPKYPNLLKVTPLTFSLSLLGVWIVILAPSLLGRTDVDVTTVPIYWVAVISAWAFCSGCIAYIEMKVSCLMYDLKLKKTN